MSSLFRSDSEEDGIFVISTSNKDDSVVSIKFESDMDGAIDHKDQYEIVQKLMKNLQKICVDKWNKDNE